MMYEKYHDPWTSSDLASGAALNYIDGYQWSCIADDIIDHDHSTRYYSKTTADATFFSLTYKTGFDADMIDGQHLTDLVSSALPKGAIMIWSGTDGNVPDDWYCCDGSTHNGVTSPDLRGRFVLGSILDEIGGTGDGSYTANITGSISIAGHTLTNDEMPIHTHGFTDTSTNIASTPYAAAAQNGAVGNNTARNSTTGATGGGGEHGHTGSEIALYSLDVTPRYYVLWYIIKTV